MTAHCRLPAGVATLRTITAITNAEIVKSGGTRFVDGPAVAVAHNGVGEPIMERLGSRPHDPGSGRMTSDRFRARADESIKAAHAVADPVRKVALMDVAQRWQRLAAQIDGEHGQRRRLDHSFGLTHEEPTSAEIPGLHRLSRPQRG